MSDICKRLAEPLDPAVVSWRVGPTTKDKSKGMALAYIDARDVMWRLDQVCGPENWQDEYPWSDGKRVVCRIGIKIDGEWIWKTDGAGDTDTEGEKGALSDAFKRAAVKWGVGRYLYDVETPWVQIEQRGNSYVIPDSERVKLAGVLRRQFTPSAAPPAGTRNAAPPSLAATNGTAAPAPAARAPHPEEPAAATEARGQAIRDFWSRGDYGIDPEVVDGGMGRWDYWFLTQAEAAPGIDAFDKLKQDNKRFYDAWAGNVAPPVVKQFNARMSGAFRRVRDLEGAAA